MPFSLRETPADLLTIAPHKFYGPKGIGGLFIKRGTSISPILFGAGHERGMRPGTENVPGIAGFAKACEIAARDMRQRVMHTTTLREMLLSLLGTEIPGLILNGNPGLRLPNTLNVSIPGIRSAELAEKLGDIVAVSTGSACHSGRHTPSPVLMNMGLTENEALSSLRLSVGKDNTEDEIRSAARIIALNVRALIENLS
jgi:cysteine desulfurase